jgi:hypothetical protein
MPEAPIDKDDDMCSDKREVGLSPGAGNRPVQAESESGPMQS